MIFAIVDLFIDFFATFATSLLFRICRVLRNLLNGTWIQIALDNDVGVLFTFILLPFSIIIKAFWGCISWLDPFLYASSSSSFDEEYYERRYFRDSPTPSPRRSFTPSFEQRHIFWEPSSAPRASSDTENNNCSRQAAVAAAALNRNRARMVDRDPVGDDIFSRERRRQMRQEQAEKMETEMRLRGNGYGLDPLRWPMHSI